MMNRVIHFDSGLPRCGTTMLTALLNQHPDIYAAPQSVLPVLLQASFDILYEIPDQIYRDPICSDNVLSNIMFNYYQDIKEPIVIDKSRLWPDNIPKIKKYINKKPKFICCVRNPLDILASFITLLENSNGLNYIDANLKYKNLDINNTNRCRLLMSEEGTVYRSMKILQKAFQDGYRDLFMLIDYDSLVSNTNDKLNELLYFLGLETFTFDLDNINVRFKEDSFKSFGLKDMHKVRHSVCKTSRDYKSVLEKSIIEEYKDLDFWRGEL